MSFEEGGTRGGSEVAGRGVVVGGGGRGEVVVGGGGRGGVMEEGEAVKNGREGEREMVVEEREGECTEMGRGEREGGGRG